MNRDVAIMREAVVKLTQLLAGMGVRVTQQGMQAFVETDVRTGKVKRVNIPHIPDNATESLIFAIQGFIDHEVSHILHTDWEWQKKASSDPGRPSLQAIWNTLEDTFIERAMAKRFPGAHYNLDRLHEFFLAEITTPIFNEATKAGDVERIFSVLAVPAARAWSGQGAFQRYMEDKWHLIADQVERLGVLVKAVPLIKNTQGSYELALLWHDALYPPKPKPEATPVPEDGKCEEDGKGKSEETKPDKSESPEKPDRDEDDTGAEKEPADETKAEADDEEAPADREPGDMADDEPSSDDEGEPDAGSDAGDETDPEPEEGEGAGSESDGAPDDESDELDGRGTAGGEEDPDDTDGGTSARDGAEEDDDVGREGAAEEGEAEREYKVVVVEDDAKIEDGAKPGRELSETPILDIRATSFDEALAKSIGAAAEAAAHDAPYVVFTKDYDVTEIYHPGSRYQDDWLTAMDDKTRHMVGVMQKDIERMMAARSQVVRLGGYRTGRVRSSSLSRVLVGDDRVFDRKKENRSREVAVSLLIDCSGSMRCGKASLAFEAAYALASTLERVQIKHEVLGFTTKSERLREDGLMKKIHEEEERTGIQFSRVEPLWTAIFKGAEERMTPEVRRRFASAPGEMAMANNVDGEGVEIAAMRLLQRREPRKVLMVLSDGLPEAAGDREAQRSHLRKTVKDVCKAGIECLGIGIATDAVKRFYPKSLVLRDISGLPAAVMGELRQILTV